MSGLLPAEPKIAAQVIGPAYLDEVVEVDGSLCPPPAPRIDYSRTEAHREPLPEPGTFLLIESPGGDCIRITDPDTRRGTRIVLAEERILDDESAPALRTTVRLRGRRALLGGMGAGYALALGARLVLPLGETGSEGREICRLLDVHGIAYRAVPVSGQFADTTTLVWSSAGDKLPIGRRTASTVVQADALLKRASEADLTLVTSLPNSTVSRAVERLGGWVMFTPSLRNVGEPALGEIAERVDAMSMNQVEWRRAEEAVGERCPLVVVTRGAEGASVRFRNEAGELRWVSVPAAPGVRVVDANHAGEAFTSALLGALVASQWPEAMRRGAYDAGAVREAAWQGSLAAGMELGIRDLAFPSRDDVLARREGMPVDD